MRLTLGTQRTLDILENVVQELEDMGCDCCEEKYQCLYEYVQTELRRIKNED